MSYPKTEDLPQLEKNIPMSGHGNAATYRRRFVESMVRGDSFEVPSSQRNIWARLIYGGKKVKGKFQAHKQINGKVRIWKIK